MFYWTTKSAISVENVFVRPESAKGVCFSSLGTSMDVLFGGDGDEFLVTCVPNILSADRLSVDVLLDQGGVSKTLMSY